VARFKSDCARAVIIVHVDDVLARVFVVGRLAVSAAAGIVPADSQSSVAVSAAGPAA
jgi:hypothetical protein